MHALKKWWVLLGMVTTLSAQESVSMTPAEATKTISELTEAHEKLRVFALQGLIGRRYEKLEAVGGEIYQNAVVVNASGRNVEIRYSDDGQERVKSLDVSEGPPAWSVLVPPSKVGSRPMLPMSSAQS